MSIGQMVGWLVGWLVEMQSASRRAAAVTGDQETTLPRVALPHHTVCVRGIYSTVRMPPLLRHLPGKYYTIFCAVCVEGADQLTAKWYADV